MLDRFRRGQRWLTAIFISVIGAVFVFFLGLGGPLQGGGPTGDFVVQLDDLVIDRIDFDRVRESQERRLRESLGSQFDSAGAEAFLDQRALRTVVEQVVLANSARELGLHVSKQEIQAYLRESPFFRDENGRFDQDLVVDTIERAYGSQRSFLQTIEREFLVQKAVGLLSSQASVTDDELRRAVTSRLEEVTLALVVLDTRELPAGSEITQEEIDVFSSGNEAQLREEFAKRRAEFHTPDRVHARHLLILSDPASGETETLEARGRAEAARARLAAGAAFADVAADVSEDQGTREQGGDLGFIARSEVSLAIAEAAFTIEVGEISEVIKSERGFHVVTIDEKQAGGDRSFEDASDELARGGAMLLAARTRAQALSQELSEAVRAGSSLEDAARERGLTLVRTSSLRRRPDGYILDLGAAPEVMATAFAIEPGTSSPRVFEVSGRLVLVSVTSAKAAEELDIEAQLAGTRDGIIEQKRNESLRAWIDAEEARLSEAGRLRINADLVIGS